GRFPDAEKLFQSCLQRQGGDNYAVHYNLGLAFFFQRRWDDSLQHYQKSLVHNPTFAHTYHGIGNVYETNRMLDQALEFFTKATVVDPKAADSYFNLGTSSRRPRMLYRMLDQALEFFTKTAVVDPKAADSNFNLGSVMQQLRRHEEAVKHFQVAADLTPEGAGTSPQFPQT
ncbi:hypothetical protein T484DRAFT_1791004, partial [Baffinella frigidus]